MKAPSIPGLDLPSSPARPRLIVKPKTASGRAKKGYRVEREIAALHMALGVRAERVPLSGGLAKPLGPEWGGDLKVWLWGADQSPAVAEVKARAAGGGFVQLERWLGSHDLLILKRNNLSPMLLLPWATWARLIGGAR